MTQPVKRARETSKFGSTPVVEALWRVRGVDGAGREMIPWRKVQTCGADGERLLPWYEDLNVDRVAKIEIEVEVDEFSLARGVFWSSAKPQSVVVAETEDTKFRILEHPPLTADNRRLMRFAVSRARLGSHLLLSAHVTRGAVVERGQHIGQYLARTPHSERLKIRFDCPDWKDGGGLPIVWKEFDEIDAELVWRWRGLDSLSEAEPAISLEVNSLNSSVQSLLQTSDNPRKLVRLAVAHFIAAEAMFELAVVAASQVDAGRPAPQDTGIAAVLNLVASQLGESSVEVLDDLRTPTEAAALFQRLRRKLGWSFNLSELIDQATQRGGVH
jgi:hypothetical protein